MTGSEAFFLVAAGVALVLGFFALISGETTMAVALCALSTAASAHRRHEAHR